MPNVCCVPECKSGYRIRNQKETTTSTSASSIALHKLPQETTRRKQWIHAIPRKDWSPNAFSCVCEKHFHPSDYVIEVIDQRKSRNKERERKRLKETAVPSIFPNLPIRFSKKKPKERSRNTLSEVRHDNDLLIAEEQISMGKVLSLVELKTQIDVQCDAMVNVDIIDKEDELMFIGIQYDDKIPINIVYSILIRQDLELMVSLKGVEIPLSKFPSVESGKIDSCEQIYEVIMWLKINSEKRGSILDTGVLYHAEKIEHLVEENDSNAILGSEEAMDESVIKRLLFLCEQLKLSVTSAKGRRYSNSLLALSAMWESTSTSLYKLILEDNVLCLPSLKWIQRLSRGFTVETGFSNSTKSYLSERIKCLNERERMVTVLIDEIYNAQRVEYSNGKFYGHCDSNNISKTLLCFMISAVAGSYRDIIAMLPIASISADVIHEHFMICIKSLKKIGFDVVATSVDGFSANRAFYQNSLCHGHIEPCIKNPFDDNGTIYLLFDTTHLFKNIYTNFLNRRTFICPNFRGIEMKPNFEHLITIYQNELNSGVKMAHKLNDTVLNPRPIERSKVNLADACFHDSTIATLQYYSNEDADFTLTANFLLIIRRFWNLANAKNVDMSKRKRNPSMSVVHDTSSNQLSFLLDFLNWICEWERISKKNKCGGLSSETFFCLRQTALALRGITFYLLEEKYLDYVCMGKLSSDPIERRFGRYRQMSGGNYFVSVKQILEGEKCIRLQSLARLSSFDFHNVDGMLNDPKENAYQISRDVSSLLNKTSHLNMENIFIKEGQENIIFYIAGYIARQLIKKTTCESCARLYIKSKNEIKIRFSSDISISEREKWSKRSIFFDLLNRGGLCGPSDLLFITCIHVWSFYEEIFHNNELKMQFMTFKHPLQVFVGSIIPKISSETNTSAICQQKCSNDHRFEDALKKIAAILFNCCSKNYAAETNDEIHKGKKRSKNEEASNPSTSDARKIVKLTSRFNV